MKPIINGFSLNDVTNLPFVGLNFFTISGTLPGTSTTTPVMPANIAFQISPAAMTLRVVGILQGSSNIQISGLLACRSLTGGSSSVTVTVTDPATGQVSDPFPSFPIFMQLPTITTFAAKTACKLSEEQIQALMRLLERQADSGDCESE